MKLFSFNIYLIYKRQLDFHVNSDNRKITEIDKILYPTSTCKNEDYNTNIFSPNQVVPLNNEEDKRAYDYEMQQPKIMNDRTNLPERPKSLGNIPRKNSFSASRPFLSGLYSIFD